MHIGVSNEDVLCWQYRALAPMYYRGAAAAIIVYDITQEVLSATCKFIVK